MSSSRKAASIIVVLVLAVVALPYAFDLLGDADEWLPKESSFAELEDGRRLHYREAGGNAAGDPFVLVHGLPSAHSEWAEMPAKLAERNRTPRDRLRPPRLWLLEPLGRGRSGAVHAARQRRRSARAARRAGDPARDPGRLVLRWRRRADLRRRASAPHESRRSGRLLGARFGVDRGAGRHRHDDRVELGARDAPLAGTHPSARATECKRAARRGLLRSRRDPGRLDRIDGGLAGAARDARGLRRRGRTQRPGRTRAGTHPRTGARPPRNRRSADCLRRRRGSRGEAAEGEARALRRGQPHACRRRAPIAWPRRSRSSSAPSVANEVDATYRIAAAREEDLAFSSGDRVGCGDVIRRRRPAPEIANEFTDVEIFATAQRAGLLWVALHRDAGRARDPRRIRARRGPRDGRPPPRARRPPRPRAPWARAPARRDRPRTSRRARPRRRDAHHLLAHRLEPALLRAPGLPRLDEEEIARDPELAALVRNERDEGLRNRVAMARPLANDATAQAERFSAALAAKSASAGWRQRPRRPSVNSRSAHKACTVAAASLRTQGSGSTGFDAQKRLKAREGASLAKGWRLTSTVDACRAESSQQEGIELPLDRRQSLRHPPVGEQRLARLKLAPKHIERPRSDVVFAGRKGADELRGVDDAAEAVEVDRSRIAVARAQLREREALGAPKAGADLDR